MAQTIINNMIATHNYVQDLGASHATRIKHGFLQESSPSVFSLEVNHRQCVILSHHWTQLSLLSKNSHCSTGDTSCKTCP